jgi:SAM-dependent methyltransferase
MEELKMKTLIDYYDDYAEKWAEDWYSNESMLPYLKEFVKLLPNNARVLDLCCGAGYESMRMNNLGVNVVGVDLSKKSIDSYVKPIICLETRKVYRTQIDAAKDTNISKDMINVMCNCGGYNRSKNSLHFVFFDDYKNMSDSDITRILSAVSKQIKKVRCIETGVVFSSVTEAAKSVGDQTTNISKCCKYPNRICKGYHWEYIEKEEVV